VRHYLCLYGFTSLSIIDKLENKMNKVILSSNQTLIWESLNAVGCSNNVKGFGKLFNYKI